jgi:hypothetical protein
MYAAYTQEGIWAVGNSPEEANAEYYRAAVVDPDETNENGELLWPPLETAPMTERLAAKIEAEGFDCKYDSYTILPDGSLDLEEEEA